MELVLLIDDDLELCELTSEFLVAEGYTVEAVHDGNTGLAKASAGNYDLVVLDIMLPGMNGLDVLRNLRATSHVPVLLLTARGAEIDRIIGLELGSDDYLPKPCNPRELLARIRAVLRRSQSEPRRAARLHVGDVELDPARRTVTRAGEPISLTAMEFSVLELLLRSGGMVVTREELAKTVFGREIGLLDRTIDVHVSKIRKKLCEHPGWQDPIKTIRGVGYIYSDVD